MSVVVLRPQPGAAATANRLRALGLEAVTAPLFTVRPLAWAAPDPEAVEAVLFTSANAPRCAGPQLCAFTRLPCYAVGPATAAAVRTAGFADIRTGPGDGAALLAMAQAANVTRVLHLCGREHVPLDTAGIEIVRRQVYAADAVAVLPGAAREALGRGALALLHSPRAAALFAGLVDAAGIGRGRIPIAAISGNAAGAAGLGWKEIAVAPRPNGEALLELARRLCQTERGRLAGTGG